jgi:hypothetical protein
VQPIYIGTGITQDAYPYSRPAPPPPPETHPADLLRDKVMSLYGAGRVHIPPFINDWTRTTPEIKQALREMLCNPVVKPALFGKIFAVAALDLQIHPAGDSDYDKQVADFHAYAFERGGPMDIAIGILTGGLVDGFSVLHAPMKEYDRGAWKKKWGYRAFKPKDTEWLTPVADEYRNVIAVLAWEGGRQVSYPVNTPYGNLIYTPYMPLWGNPQGMSDLRAAYGPWYKMKLAEKFRAIHLEKFTSPALKGTYPYGDHYLKTSVEEAMEGMASRKWLSVPDGVVVEALQMATRGEAEFSAAIRDYTDQIVLSIRGATLQMLVANAGGDLRGDSKTQLSESELFVWYLQKLITGVYNQWLIPLQTEANFADADYPTATLGSVNDGDMEASMRIDTALAQIGFKHSRGALAKRYSRQWSSGPEDDVTPAGPAAPPPGGGLPFSDPTAGAEVPAAVPFRGR